MTRRILHRMYHQCGNTDTYLSSPLPSPPNPRRIASEPTNPLVPAVHDLTLAASSFLPSLSSLDSTFSPNSARFPLPSFLDIPLYDLRASASCSTHPTNREQKESWSLHALARIPTTNTWAFVDVAPSPSFSRDATMLTR